jgi:hypothetical protein
MLRNLRLIAFMLATALTVPMIAAAEAVRPLIGNKIEAYSGLQNIQVRILRVGERLDNRALVQITGIDHDWDGRIQKMNVEKTFKDVRYSIEVKGKRYVALIMNSGIGELHLPGESQPVNIYPNSALASEGIPDHFLTAYIQQSDVE